mgnify:CR=1 FL=1|tara:strand:- start:92 stop:310 length:219 start_codon:yes stop_codon:yes gene_type:complete
MKKIILEVKMQYVVNENECPKAVFQELSKKDTITSNDIGIEKYVTNKTADWLAEHTDKNENGSFISYQINNY